MSFSDVIAVLSMRFQLIPTYTPKFTLSTGGSGFKTKNAPLGARVLQENECKVSGLHHIIIRFGNVEFQTVGGADFILNR